MRRKELLFLCIVIVICFITIYSIRNIRGYIDKYNSQKDVIGTSEEFLERNYNEQV